MLGFHGCSETRARRAVLAEEDLRASMRSYDWIGNGIYFWDRDPRRAHEFAINKKSKDPTAVGAIINPGRCLDLRCRDGQEILRMAYEFYCKEFGIPSEENSSFKEGVPLRRDLDCLIIETACSLFSDKENPFDTVIGTFFEGKDIYPGAGMRDKTHTQICVRNPKCILGYFIPKIGRNL